MMFTLSFIVERVLESGREYWQSCWASAPGRDLHLRMRRGGCVSAVFYHDHHLELLSLAMQDVSTHS